MIRPSNSIWASIILGFHHAPQIVIPPIIRYSKGFEKKPVYSFPNNYHRKPYVHKDIIKTQAMIKRLKILSKH